MCSVPENATVLYETPAVPTAGEWGLCGPDGADGAVFADSLPPWAIGATWTCFASAGAICLNASGMGSINEIIPALPDGGQVVYVVNGNYSTDMTDY